MKKIALILMGMILSTNGASAALTNGTEADNRPSAALLVFDQTTQKTCYVKDVSFSGDLVGAITADEAQQSVAESILAQTKADAITECTGQTLAEAREIAYGIRTGKQIALGPAGLLAGAAYYAACTAINAVHLSESIQSTLSLSPTPWTLSGVLSATVCLPVTSVNIALIFITAKTAEALKD